MGEDRNIIKVGSLNLKELFEKNLKIPEYQRPYDWTEEHVLNLLEDLRETFEKNREKIYLLGNLVFHKNENNNTENNNDEKKVTWNIVDGQQRIITLALILYVLNETEVNETTEEEKIIKNSLAENESWYALSAQNLKKNYEVIKKFLETNLKGKYGDFKNFLLKKIVFTYAKTNDIDKAFILFDSQNTRGKELKRKDILKVHHIRFIKESEKRKLWAKFWEKASKSINEDREYDELDELFEFLAITRKAIKEELTNIKNIDVYKEFKKEVENDENLNNYSQAPIFENFEFIANKDNIEDINKDEILLFTKNIRLKKNIFYLFEGYKYIPFQINYDIEGGLRFFYFLRKYYGLYKVLKDKYKNIFCIFDELGDSGNIYLRQIYKSLILFFVDKFGFEKLEDFAVKILSLLLYYRLNASQIRRNSITKFNWTGDSGKEASLNLYKLIFLKSSLSAIEKEINKYIFMNFEKKTFVFENKDNNKREGNEIPVYEFSVKKRFYDEIKKGNEELLEKVKNYLEKFNIKFKEENNGK